VAAIAASVSALAAAVGVIWQYKRARFSMGVDLIMKLADQFSGPRMLEVRRAAANTLLKRAEDYDKVDEVLDFFEMIGLLSREKAVDDTFVWHSFYNWIDGYCQAAKQYINEVQEDQRSTWKDMTNLYQKLVVIEKTEEGLSDEKIIMLPDDIAAFLESETRL
jgi:hypothetical protein